MSPDEPLSIPAVRVKWYMDVGTIIAAFFSVAATSVSAAFLVPHWGVLSGLFAAWTFLVRVARSGLGRELVVRLAVLGDKGVRKRAPWIARMVDRHAAAVGIPTPEIFLLRPRAPAACAWGSGRRTGVGLRVTLAALPQELVSAMLAHEIAHLKNMDESVFNCIVALLESLVASMRWFVIGAGIHLLVLVGSRPGVTPPVEFLILIGIVALAVMAAVKICISFWIPKLLQQHEYAADAYGSVITGDPLSLAIALKSLEDIDGPDSGREEPLQMRTHPPLQDRVNALMRLLADMERQKRRR